MRETMTPQHLQVDVELPHQINEAIRTWKMYSAQMQMIHNLPLVPLTPQQIEDEESAEGEMELGMMVLDMGNIRKTWLVRVAELMVTLMNSCGVGGGVYDVHKVGIDGFTLQHGSQSSPMAHAARINDYLEGYAVKELQVMTGGSASTEFKIITNYD